jgi:23S rRNA (cytosine1962-C5)-methyltransferase
MKPAGELWLKPGKEKSLRRRHPWVYDTAVARVQGRPQAGELVSVRAADGAWLAWAAYAPASTLRARCWSFVEAETIDADWFAARVRAAVQRRSHLGEATDAVRLVFGEADGLPGFVADRYADQLVVQLQAAGVEANRALLLEALVQATGCDNVFERSDGASRQREGLAPSSGALRGAEPPPLIDVHEHGVRYLVDVRRGHKTGFYIDQRDNRRFARTLAQRLAQAHGRAPRVLNCFAYTGGFSLAAALGGASDVLSVEASAEALALAQRQWSNNGLPEASARWWQADVFDALRALRDGSEFFDLIVLDVMIPDGDGFTLARDIRRQSDVPIIFLTARSEIQDRIAGLETGADDYLVKPFEPRELLLRIASILRRSRKPDRSALVRFGPWAFDPIAEELRHEELGPVHLTSAEASLLTVLAQEPGRVFSREELASKSRISGSDRAVDVTMARLRRKLGDDSRQPRWVLTVRGEGYVLRGTE